jgi:type IV fimbrial biogenesis protein FimT
MRHRIGGFSLIEVMTAIAIFSILVAFGAPAFATWAASMRVRTVAESIQNGLRVAKSEAARRNGNVIFTFTSDGSPSCTSTAAASGRNWVVCAGSVQVQSAIGDAGGKGVNVASDFASVTFTGLGRTTLVSNGSINLTSSSGACQAAGGEIRCLNILVSTGGKIRMCDPQRAAGDPLGCS